jgi:hypothetical protein
LERIDVTGDSDTSFAKSPSPRAAKSGALLAEIGPIDPDLAKVFDAWKELPEAIRARIVALVKAARGDG